MDKGALLIIGVGFMGGSLAKSLKKKGFQAPIYGLDINPNAIEKAKYLKVINEDMSKKAYYIYSMYDRLLVFLWYSVLLTPSSC